MDRNELDAAILEAHASDDITALIALYTQAADLTETDGDIDAACFFLTQAFVFALEDGVKTASDLQSRLAEYGRAPPV